MYKKKLISVIAVGTAICAAVLVLSPLRANKAAADDDQMDSTYHSVTYNHSNGASGVILSTTDNGAETIASKGTFEVDNDGDGSPEIILNSDDFKKVARLANDMNTTTASGYQEVIDGYNDEVATNDECAEIMEKIGSGYTGTPATSGTGDGFEKADDSITKTENIKSKIGSTYTN